MPYQSFESLLKRFPYFLDKKTTSNFSKSERVFNDEFKEVYNNLYDVYLASKLNKHLLIWKVQEEPYNYDMYFHVSLPYLKSVTITKIVEEKILQDFDIEDENGEVISVETRETIQEITEDIYTETYEYSDFIDCFEYLHSDTSQNIIPDEKYLLKAETWDEYTTNKGFPENQVELGDEYDHDYSLDRFGEFFNVPRRTYTVVDNPDDYKDTIPLYDNQPTEDDYHYLQRLLYYIEHLNDTPLPVLEIYKLFSLSDAELINRERLICRMTDTTRHLKDGAYDSGWSPHAWEHKDQWCTGSTDNLFLFANVNNNTPIQGQSFVFDFKVLNSFAKKVYNTNSYNLINDSIIDESEEAWIIVPYINGVAVGDTFLESDKKWQLTTADIYEEDSTFNFKCFRSVDDAKQNLEETHGEFIVFDTDLISEEILITVKGCNNADYYVSTDGDDTHDGKTKESAFKTVNKALSMVEGEKNIIALLQGEHSLTGCGEITENTTILACPSVNTTISCDNATFFKVQQDKELTLQNIHLRYHCRKMYSEYTVFRNNNKLNYPLNVYVDVKYGKIDTYVDFDVPSPLYVLNEYEIKGNIRTGELESNTGYTTSYTMDTCTEETKKNDETTYPDFQEELKLYLNDTLTATTICDTNGDFSFKFKTPDAYTDNLEIKVVHEDTEYYCYCENKEIKPVYRVTPTITVASSFDTDINSVIDIPILISAPITEDDKKDMFVEITDQNGNLIFQQQDFQPTLEGVELCMKYGSDDEVKIDTWTIKIYENEAYNPVTATTTITVHRLSEEIVDYPELSKADWTFLDNIPSDTSNYDADDKILTPDTGDNQLYIIDEGIEPPSNLTDDDIVWIGDTEDELEINTLIRDKKKGE